MLFSSAVGELVACLDTPFLVRMEWEYMPDRIYTTAFGWLHVRYVLLYYVALKTEPYMLFDIEYVIFYVV